MRRMRCACTSGEAGSCSSSAVLEITMRGVLNSWLTSAVKARSRASASLNCFRVDSTVSASAPISSSAGRTDKGRKVFAFAIDFTSSASRCTGSVTARASHSPATADTKSTTKKPIAACR